VWYQQQQQPPQLQQEQQLEQQMQQQLQQEQQQQREQLAKGQRWLLFLRHCSECRLCEAECEFGANCTLGRALCDHIRHCTATDCTYQRCSSSQQLLKHYEHCQVGLESMVASSCCMLDAIRCCMLDALCCNDRHTGMQEAQDTGGQDTWPED
jgi:hypothetical protein